ncbi:MAG TPA: HAD-IC family P-type ATPase [Patescibacteria group bacterium]|nr:HAD-IC family P-type ATPase [Patescibacteria group bacterium]
MFSNQQGLSNDEVRRMQEKYGPNILPEKPRPSQISIFIQQLRNPFVYILLLAAGVTMIIGHFSDALIISFAVLINTILGFVQEQKAGSALYALKNYITTKAIVIREGKRIEVGTTEIVPGDTVVLAQGTKIPADGQLVFANRLYIDEAVLTGESLPVDKTKEDMVFMGTIVSSGQGIFLVETIGKSTKMGQIALQIQEKEDDTPLQRQLKKFSKQLVIVIGALTAFVFILGLFYKLSLIEIFSTSVALAVSSLPEGLLISLTVVLAIGMQKIIKHRGLVRKLSAAETLGGVSVICIDKTGTLTQGKMSVTDYIGDKDVLAKQVLLANDLDDPIVISAFEWGRTIIHDFVSKHPRLDSIPFSSKERFFASLHSWTNAQNIIFVNGAPELLVDWTNLTESEKKEIIVTIDALTKQGKRIIGFAQKEVSLNKNKLEVIDAKSGLSWIGLLAFSDPVREGVKDALMEARGAGIKITVITGDYPKTSEFVLSELGIEVQKNEILTGQELAKLSVEELSQKVKSIKLFARTTPDQKFMIVEALKKNGEIVAMMGDGVNDAPALYKADIGIVVADASDVAKESADLVLLDSNFSTIIKSVEEGRVMFENIRKIILYLMSDAFSEIILVIGGIIMGLPLPITAVQILWVNLISDGLPNMALTIDPKRADIMKEKPRPYGEKLVTPWMLVLIGIVSSVAGLSAFISFFVVYKISGSLVLAQSAAFVTLGFDSLIYVFSVRTLTAPFWKSNIFENKWLLIAVLSGFGLQIVPFITPALRDFFGLTKLDPVYWISAMGLSILMFFVIEVFKSIYRQRTVFGQSMKLQL